MDSLQRFGPDKLQPYAACSEHIGLLGETPQAYAPLVIYECFADESHREAGLAYTDAQVEVFGKHLAETSDLLPYFTGETHVETARDELLHLHYSSLY